MPSPACQGCTEHVKHAHQTPSHPDTHKHARGVLSTRRQQPPQHKQVKEKKKKRRHLIIASLGASIGVCEWLKDFD